MNSQIGQDLWVLKNTNNKTGGFFVEAGACDGVFLSNTLLLERNYGWTGICAEPNPHYYNNLCKNRKCFVTDLCLYSESGKELMFSFDEGYGGVIDHFMEPSRQNRRLSANKNIVKTISLNDLLEKFNAPLEIDYISLDTEGTELEILNTFNFDKYNVKMFTVEHNIQFRSDEDKYLKELIKLFKEKGYNEYVVEHDVWFLKGEVK